jgi:hypothetical protein
MATPTNSKALSVVMASDGESVGSSLPLARNSSNASVVSMAFNSAEPSFIDMAADSSRASDIDLAASDTDDDVYQSVSGGLPRHAQAQGRVLEGWPRHKRDTQRILTLAGAFRWPILDFLELQNWLGDDIALSMLVLSMHISSHFSGIGSAALAASLLHAGLSTLALPTAAWYFAEACEKNRTCQQVLLGSCSGCLFADM